jgi:hypothetical protein
VAFILEIPAIERFKISIDNYLGILKTDYWPIFTG